MKTVFIIIALTTGSGAIMLYYIGLRYITAKVSTMCELVFPISSVVFDYIFNGHLLSPSTNSQCSGDDTSYN